MFAINILLSYEEGTKTNVYAVDWSVVVCVCLATVERGFSYTIFEWKKIGWVKMFILFGYFAGYSIYLWWDKVATCIMALCACFDMFEITKIYYGT